MIPKTIHYCWFSGEDYPIIIQQCLKSWKKHLPDYEFILWDSNNITLDNEYARKAFKEKKWAFLTDYMRFKILFEHGGIYLDTDILLCKSLSPLLHNDSFWGRADNGFIEPVVIGAIARHPMIYECLKYYQSDCIGNSYIEVPKIVTPIFNQLGLKEYNGETERIGNNLFLNHFAFCPLPFDKADVTNYMQYRTDETYCIHLWNAAWFDEFRFLWNGRKKKGWLLIIKKIGFNPFQSIEFYKNVLYHIFRK